MVYEDLGKETIIGIMVLSYGFEITSFVEDNLDFNKNITEEELIRAMDTLQVDKLLGFDGYPIKSYNDLINALEDDLL
jgi:uncharacterized protein YvpB